MGACMSEQTLTSSTVRTTTIQGAKVRIYDAPEKIREHQTRQVEDMALPGLGHGADE